jgi:hypothetical protein
MIFEKAIERTSRCYDLPLNEEIFDYKKEFKDFLDAYR